MTNLNEVTSHYSRGQPKPANCVAPQPQFSDKIGLRNRIQKALKRPKTLSLEYFNDVLSTRQILGPRTQIFGPQSSRGGHFGTIIEHYIVFPYASNASELAALRENLFENQN